MTKQINLWYQADIAFFAYRNNLFHVIIGKGNAVSQLRVAGILKFPVNSQNECIDIPGNQLIRDKFCEYIKVPWLASTSQPGFVPYLDERPHPGK